MAVQTKQTAGKKKAAKAKKPVTKTISRRRTYMTLEDATNALGSTTMPATAGRSSQPTGISMYGMLMSELQEVKPGFELELLKLCEYLAKHNGDISYAIDNIVQLGNTPATITFDDSVPEPQAIEMLKYIAVADKKIYKGGMNSLQNDLFAQLGINGAISAEKIPARTLDGIERVVLVSPYTIRFKYNERTYDYDPYQKPSDIVSSAANPDGLIKLNPMQYKYYALRRFSDNPYAIPPLISSFESIEIEKDMLKNMRHVIRKLGAFGFLSVMVQAPMKKQNEKDEAYKTRLLAYLQEIRVEVEKGYSTGMAIGFDKAITYKLEANTANVQGARDLLNAITEMKHAGLKQDPLMLGRNFNVAETMARVIMAKLTTQIGNYQRLVATFREDLYLLMLRLAGFKLNSVYVEYDPPMIGDKLRDEQAYKAKIENRMTLRNSGIISQEAAAQELGYEESFSEKDVDYTVPHAEDLAKKKDNSLDPNKRDPNQAADPTAAGATNYSTEELYSLLHRGVDEFEYDCDGHCGVDYQMSYAAEGDETYRNIDDFILIYKSAIKQEYRKAIDRAALRIGELLADSGNGLSEQQVIDKVFYALYSEWNATFTQTQKEVINKWVSSMYKYFRTDQSYLSGVQNIPDATFGIFDVRAITYFERSDELYLGKFITDKDVTKKLTKYIKDAYIRDSQMTTPESIAALKEGFTELMNLEDWKIARIVDTTVARMRNTAAVAYMQQSGVTKYKIIGINDEKQCRYCKHMDGKVFDLQPTYDKFEKWLKGTPEVIKQDMPFVTTAYKGDEGYDLFLTETIEQLQQKGVMGFSNHPHCRCIAVAVL